MQAWLASRNRKVCVWPAAGTAGVTGPSGYYRDRTRGMFVPSDSMKALPTNV